MSLVSPVLNLATLNLIGVCVPRHSSDKEVPWDLEDYPITT